MRTFAVVMALACMFGVGLISLDAGDKVRGDKGTGSVYQWWVDSNADWHNQ